jgi:hypothetical protein
LNSHGHGGLLRDESIDCDLRIISPRIGLGAPESGVRQQLIDSSAAFEFEVPNPGWRRYDGSVDFAAPVIGGGTEIEPATERMECKGLERNRLERKRPDRKAPERMRPFL